MPDHHNDHADGVLILLGICMYLVAIVHFLRGHVAWGYGLLLGGTLVLALANPRRM
jgi:hypothetical protein